MVMESANKSKDETMGLLQDLKIKIEEYNFYVQVKGGKGHSVWITSRTTVPHLHSSDP